MRMAAAFLMVATFVFGIVPGTLLVFFALALGTAPIYGLFHLGDVVLWKALGGLLFLVPVSVMAVLGYIALFYAAGDAVTPRVARWLLAGVIANVVGIGLVVAEFEWSLLEVSYLFLPPLVVGCAHLAKFLVGTRQRRASA
jgi:hypothetical protein